MRHNQSYNKNVRWVKMVKKNISLGRSSYSFRLMVVDRQTKGQVLSLFLEHFLFSERFYCNFDYNKKCFH